MVYLQAPVLVKPKGVNLCGRLKPFREAEKSDTIFKKQSYVPIKAKKSTQFK